MFLFLTFHSFPSRSKWSIFFNSHLPELEIKAHFESCEARIFHLDLLSPENVFPDTMILPMGVFSFHVRGMFAWSLEGQGCIRGSPCHLRVPNPERARHTALKAGWGSKATCWTHFYLLATWKLLNKWFSQSKVSSSINDDNKNTYLQGLGRELSESIHSVQHLLYSKC